MLATVQRDDGAKVWINTHHIVYVYPENGEAENPGVVVLSTGEKVKLKDTATQFFDKLGRKGWHDESWD
jgi:hypothetical protein